MKVSSLPYCFIRICLPLALRWKLCLPAFSGWHVNITDVVARVSALIDFFRGDLIAAGACRRTGVIVGLVFLKFIIFRDYDTLLHVVCQIGCIFGVKSCLMAYPVSGRFVLGWYVLLFALGSRFR